MGKLSELTSLPEFAKIKIDPACKRDLDKALAMYTLAAHYGHAQTFQHLKCQSASIHEMAIKGLISLGLRFQRGLGTAQDLKKAAVCFTRALENGGKVPAYLYQKKSSAKTSETAEPSSRTYIAKYDDLTVDTQIEVTPKTVSIPPNTVVTPPQQIVILKPVFYCLGSWGWTGFFVGANV